MFIGARHPGRPPDDRSHSFHDSGDAGGQMMAIFPRKYQHPRDREWVAAVVRGLAGIYEGKWPSSAPPCPAPATGLLQGLRCRGYAARAMLHMLQLLHWPHRSACSNCCTGHTDQHAPSAALATQISKPQVLHWQHRSPCSNRCTGHKDQHARHELLLLS